MGLDAVSKVLPASHIVVRGTNFILCVQVYMIGLVRRPERRNRMIACLEELNFDYTVFDAVDGRYMTLCM